MDFKAPIGAEVVAPADGVVVDLRPNPSRTYGNQVVIDHGKGLYTMSAHLGSVAVKAGDRVNAGDVVGTVGRTGDVPPMADAHVHFEVRLGGPLPRSAGGNVVNPKDYLPRF
jgi:lysostaphin